MRLKRVIGVFVLSVFSVFIMISPALVGKCVVNATEEPQPASIGVTNRLQTEMQELMKKDAELRHQKVMEFNIQKVSSKHDGNSVEVVFSVEKKTLLNYSRAEDVPVLKGRLMFVQKQKSILTSLESQYVNNDINEWKKDLTSYIKEPSTSFDRFKLTANLNQEQVDPSSIKVFIEGPLGDYVPYNLSDIPTAQQIENESSKAIAEISVSYSTALKAQNTNALTKPKTAQYIKYNAYTYANTWTSNTTKYCRWYNPWGAMQDESYYNTAYTSNLCNDCANYVSQSVHAGGIPTDGTWYAGSPAWVNVSQLASYMTSQNYWSTTTQVNCKAGYPFRLASPEHFMLMVYNDGYTYRFSAHTNDRLNATWTNSMGSPTWYNVIY